jgi:carbonic anhydrase
MHGCAHACAVPFPQFPRTELYRILGLQEGESHVIRNAGGVVTDDEIRSLAISHYSAPRKSS